MCQSSFEKEQEKIRTQIWSLIPVEDAVVLDVGVGLHAASTKTLIDKGATVIAVDSDLKALITHKELDALFVCCNIKDMPFKANTVDVVVFYFTLHEIDPLFHNSIISGIARMSSQVIIVEPTPGTTPGYQRYEKVWRQSMHAVDKFEDYQPAEYWETLVKTCGFNQVMSQTVTNKEKVPFDVLKDMVSSTVEWLKKDSVPEKYIKKAKDLLEYAGEEMKLSDVAVIMGSQ